MRVLFFPRPHLAANQIAVRIRRLEVEAVEQSHVAADKEVVDRASLEGDGRRHGEVNRTVGAHGLRAVGDA